VSLQEHIKNVRECANDALALLASVETMTPDTRKEVLMRAGSLLKVGGDEAIFTARNECNPSA
jgi:hypothetical protein